MSAYDVLAARTGKRARRDEPIAPFTSYRLGGPAAVFLDARSDEDLAALGEAIDESGLPLLVLGRGSNMLVSDRGFQGIAVRLSGVFKESHVHGEAIEAGGAVAVPSLATLAASHSLTGFEFAVAIPASLGGAIAMNAGAHGHSISEVLEHATVFDLGASAARTVPGSELGFEYRSSALPPRSIVTGGRMALRPGDPATIAAGMREARSWRRETQPIGLPNAGSVFKNPPGAESAGRLVERICGKGMRIGGARISEVHANFIVADPRARADDVYTLIRRIQRMVRENAGVELETEVKLIGEFEEISDGARS